MKGSDSVDDGRVSEEANVVLGYPLSASTAFISSFEEASDEKLSWGEKLSRLVQLFLRMEIL